MTPTRQELLLQKNQIIERDGVWTAHNIHLGHDVYTIDEHSTSDLSKRERILQLMEDYGNKELSKQRILDLACLEGLYSIEAAKKGATVIGADIRDEHLRKAQYAKDALGLRNLTFVKSDVRTITKESFESFDTILMLGILYHLPSPDILPFLETMAHLCRDLLIIDTHIAIRPEMTFARNNATYEGAYFVEHPRGATMEQKRASGWASIDNDVSVWLTLDSLTRALRDVGFSSVLQCLLPLDPSQPKDRVTLVAKKSRRLAHVS